MKLKQSGASKKIKTIKTIPCPHCNKSFAPKSLSRHVKSVHLKIVHECDLCQQRFTRKSNLDEHKKSHYEEKKEYICLHCDKTYSSRDTLGRHVRNTHFKCYTCKQTFINKSLLLQHKHAESKEEDKSKKSHAQFDVEKKEVYCPQCDKTFASNDNLSRHVRQFHLTINHKCEICHQTYTRKCDLIEHKKSHAKSLDKIEILAQSNYMSINSCNNIEYRNNVAGEEERNIAKSGSYQGKEQSESKPTMKLTEKCPCPHCDSSFAHLKNLRKHIREFHPDSDHTCDLKEHQNFHIESNREDKVNRTEIQMTEKRPCRHCDLTFSSNWTLRRHMLRKHDISITEINDEKSGMFKDLTSLSSLTTKFAGSKEGKISDQNQMSLSPFQCNRCLKILASSKALKKHLTFCLQFPCDHCEYKFSHGLHLKTHKRTAHGIKEFHCSMCTASFGYSRHLRRHYQEVHKIDENDTEDLMRNKDGNTHTSKRRRETTDVSEETVKPSKRLKGEQDCAFNADDFSGNSQSAVKRLGRASKKSARESIKRAAHKDDSDDDPFQDLDDSDLDKDFNVDDKDLSASDEDDSLSEEENAVHVDNGVSEEEDAVHEDNDLVHHKNVAALYEQDVDMQEYDALVTKVNKTVHDKDDLVLDKDKAVHEKSDAFHVEEHCEKDSLVHEYVLEKHDAVHDVEDPLNIKNSAVHNEHDNALYEGENDKKCSSHDNHIIFDSEIIGDPDNSVILELVPQAQSPTFDSGIEILEALNKSPVKKTDEKKDGAENGNAANSPFTISVKAFAKCEHLEKSELRTKDSAECRRCLKQVSSEKRRLHDSECKSFTCHHCEQTFQHETGTPYVGIYIF